MTRATVLRWLERSLVAAGIVLGIWCAKVIDVQDRTAALPIPEQYVRVPGSVLGKLIAPRMGLSATVLEGSDDATLAKAAGHLEETPMPGEPGNVGIAGHRDTIFRALRRTKIGDEYDLRTAGGFYRYRVTRTLIVKPEEVSVLDPTPRPTLTLVTCWPFEFIGHAPKRFIVQADMVDGSGGAGGSGR